MAVNPEGLAAIVFCARPCGLAGRVSWHAAVGGHYLMGLGLRKIKQEMTGTGGGRHETRASAKKRSKKARRETAKKLADPTRA
jgi:hypothetical protein